MLHKLQILILFFLFPNLLFGQVAAKFNVESPTCMEETISLSNQSSGFDSLLWDFCLDNLNEISSIHHSTKVSDANIPTAITLVYDSLNWYAFMSSRSNNKLFLLDYGNSLSNNPSITDLGNPGNLLNGPKNMELFKEDNIWYGLIINWGNSSLIRLKFGDGLSGNPTAVNLGNLSGWSKPRGLDIVNANDSIIAIVSSFDNSKLTLLNFGNSITNTPSGDDILDIGSGNPLISGPMGIRIIENDNKWYGFLASNKNGKILRLDFGSSLFSTPTFQEIFSIGSPTEIAIEREGFYYQLYGSSANGSLFRIKYGKKVAEGAILTENLGNFGKLNNTFGFDLVSNPPSYTGIIVDYNSNDVHIIEFPDSCQETHVNFPYSNEFEPKNISYSSADTFEIRLNAYDEFGNQSFYTDTLVVKDISAPFVSFETDNACILNENNFLGETPDDDLVSEWRWEFGDGGSSTGKNVQYQYNSTGKYLVSLSIQTYDGCTNHTEDTIAIFEAPIASFDLPSDNLCTYTELEFINSSNVIGIDSAKFTWNYNDEEINTSINGSYSFSSSGVKDILLIAEITGCVDSLIQQINISPGPIAGFTWTTNCFGDSIAFINNSETDNIDYVWDFGDESSGSGEFEPKHLYSSAGIYEVELIVQSQDNGCTNNIIKEVEVAEPPLAKIEPGDFIENLSAEVTGVDLTIDDNFIERWTWKVLPDGELQEGQVVEFTFSSPGEYDVELYVESFQGCEDTILDVIQVEESEYPSVNISLQEDGCINEKVIIENNTLNYESLMWDFCFEDIPNPQAPQEVISVTDADIPEGFQIVYSEGNWYGFVSSRNNSKLFRLDFGVDLKNNPEIIDLGNPFSLLSQPKDLVFKKENGVWYAIGANYGNSHIFRYEFGDGLNNAPTNGKDIGNLSDWSVLRGIDLAEDNGNIALAVTSQNNNKVSIVNFGASITYDPVTADVYDINSELFNKPMGVRIILANGKWYGAIANSNGNNIIKLNFGENLFATPSVESLPGVVTQPTNILLVQEGFKHYIFGIKANGGYVRYDFGDTFDNPAPDPITFEQSEFKNIYASAIVYNSPFWKAYFVNYGTHSIHEVDFIKNDYTHADKSFETVEHPEISFTSPGKYPVELTAYHKNGSATSITKYITVSNNTAPSISFSSPNACLSNPNIFNGAVNDTSTINSYTWYIDQLDTLAGQEVSYQFAAADTFRVILEAEAANGCSQRITKEIPVYEEPIPNFAIPDGILCSNSEIAFTNTSETFQAGPVIEWTWNFNDEGGSDEESTAFTFAESGGKIVSLTASIPGCSPKMTKSFNVTAGPEVNFTAENLCFGEELQYINETTGSGIVAYDWDLGNGQTSTDVNPSLVYGNPDAYDVKLAVANNLGCVNALQKTVTVHALPVVDFEHGLACSSATQFFDKSAVANANMEVWQWYLRNDHGGYDSAANSKDPIIGFPKEGNYRLKLVAGSNFGCYDSTEMDVMVMPGPDAVIGYDPFCLGDSIQFKDLSDTHPDNPIQSWYWEINGKGYFSQEPRYYFEGPGYHVVSLKVDAKNLCSDTVFEVIKANRLPQPDFTVLNPCENESVVFADNSHSPDDPVASYSWNFDGMKTASGPKAAFRFPGAKDYQVRLEVTTQNGCTRATTKQVPVHPYPKAKFSVYPKVGVPPQPVALENNSAGAVSYQWNFGETPDSLATDFEPQYTYHAVGDYPIRLVAVNEYGCSDTARNEIAIRLPVLDVELERVVKVANDNDIQLVARINNNGSLIVSEMDILIEMGDITLKESFGGPLEAGEGKNYPLNFQIVDHMKHDISYACITLLPRFMTYEDETIDNNKICIDLNEAFTALEPFPNPTSDMLYIPFIAPNTTDLVKIRLLDMRGNVLHTEDIKPAHPGMNQHALKLTAISDGLYLLRIDLKDRSLVRKVRIVN